MKKIITLTFFVLLGFSMQAQLIPIHLLRIQDTTEVGQFIAVMPDADGTDTVFHFVDMYFVNDSTLVLGQDTVLTSANVNDFVVGGGGGNGSIATDNTLTGTGTNSEPLGADTTLIATIYDLSQIDTNDADADNTNEAQTITKSGNTITLSQANGVGGGSVVDEVNDADADDENELLENVSVDVNGNLTFDYPGTANDIVVLNQGFDKQDLTYTASTQALSIENGNTIFLQIQTDNTLLGIGTSADPIRADTSVLATKSDLNNITPQDTDVEVTQSAHGFSAAAPVYHDGTSWRAANTNSPQELHTAFVKKVIDANTFTIVEGGVIEKTAHGLTGDNYYLTETGVVSEDPAYWIRDKVYTVLDADNVLAHHQDASINNMYSPNFPLDEIQLQVLNTPTITVNITTSDASGYTIEWGDDTQTSASSGANETHTYNPNYSGFITISNIDRLKITEIDISGEFFFDVEKLYTFAPLISSFETNTNKNECYGNLGSKPNSLTYIDFQSGRIGGDISDKLENVERIRIVGSVANGAHTVRCDVSKFPSSLEYVGVVTGSFYGRFSSSTPILSHLDIKDTPLTDTLAQKTKHQLDVNFADLAANMPNTTTLTCYDSDFSYSNTTINYNGNPKTFICVATPGRGMTSLEVSDLLEDLATFTTWDAPANLFLTGHGAPNQAGTTAITTLQNNGVNVVINSAN